MLNQPPLYWLSINVSILPLEFSNTVPFGSLPPPLRIVSGDPEGCQVGIVAGYIESVKWLAENASSAKLLNKDEWRRNSSLNLYGFESHI